MSQRGRSEGKRPRRGRLEQDQELSSATDVCSLSDSPLTQMFESFQLELDSRHDKHERLVKISRDVTIASKRIIFLIHRITSEEDRQRVISEVETKLIELEATKWRLLAIELKHEDQYQYLRAYSAGLQEYIEAICLYYFIKDRSFCDLSCVQRRLTFLEEVESVASENQSSETSDQLSTLSVNPSPPPQQLPLASQFRVHIPPSEFILGLADVTGELMRIAVQRAGAGDRATLADICRILRSICTGLTGLDGPAIGRDMMQKLNVMKQSVAKVESACYALHVRLSEFPAGISAVGCGPSIVSRFDAEPPEFVVD